MPYLTYSWLITIDSWPITLWLISEQSFSNICIGTLDNTMLGVIVNSEIIRKNTKMQQQQKNVALVDHKKDTCIWQEG